MKTRNTIVMKKCLRASEPLFRQGLTNVAVSQSTGYSLPTLIKARKLLGIAALPRGRQFATHAEDLL